MFQLWLVIFLILLQVQGHTVPHWKALRYAKYELRGLSCNSNLNICQVVMKSVNLLHKQDFDDSQLKSTVIGIKSEQKNEMKMKNISFRDGLWMIDWKSEWNLIYKANIEYKWNEILIAFHLIRNGMNWSILKNFVDIKSFTSKIGRN